MTISKEELFFEELHQQINIELDKSYKPKNGDQLNFLGLSEDALALAQAGILLGGLGSAAFTFGLGLAVAGSVIIVIKAGKVCYELYQNSSPPATLPESRLADPNVLAHHRNLRRLALYLILRQAGYSSFIRYYYGLHQTVLDDKNIRKFVQVIVTRMIKKLCAELARDPVSLPNPEDLTDFLLASIHRSKLLTTDEIALKPVPNSSPMRLTAMPVEVEIKKYLALQCWLSFDGTTVRIMGTQTSYLTSLWDLKSTRDDFGYIAMPRGKESSIPALAIDKTQLQDLPLSQQERDNLIRLSLFPQIVTVQDIQDYEADYRTSTVKISFNQFISDKYRRPSKAYFRREYHNLALAGDYSNIDAYGCTLTDCDGSNGRFFQANFTRSTLVRFITNNTTNLQYISAEGSIWDGTNTPGNNPIVIMADISNGNFSGSTWTNYKISTTASQMGSQWLWAKLDPNMLIDVQASVFEERLNTEHTARVEQARRIDSLEQQYQILERLVATNDRRAETFMRDLRTDITGLRAELGTIQQIQLVALGQQIEGLAAGQRATTQALSVVTSRLENYIQQQIQRENIVDDKIADLRKRQDVFYQSSLYCTYWVYTDDYRTKKATYIPLYVKSNRSLSISEPPELLNETLQKELNVRTKYVMVHAPTSAGQTFGVTAFGESINAVHISPTSKTVITINASKIGDRENNIVTTLLDTFVYKNAERSILSDMKKYPFVIHLSKLDASGIPPEKLIKDCEEFTKNSEIKFILSGRSAYMQEVRAYLEIHFHAMPDQYSDYTVQPLNEKQIQDFFNLFTKSKLAHRCRELQQRGIINISSLARTPLMLTIMTGVLFDYATNRANQFLQEIDFYKDSWHALYERIRFRLPGHYENDEPAFMGVMEHLAKLMLKNNTDSVIYERTQALPRTTKEEILHELLETKTGTCSPLSIVEIAANRYRVSFSHETLGYYLMARSYVDNLFEPNFNNKTFEQTWNQHYLADIPGILPFLVQLLQSYPESTPANPPPAVRILRQDSDDALTTDEGDSDDEDACFPKSRAIAQQRLLAMTALTHKDNPKKQSYKKAASNGLSVLCKWGRNLFGQDLSQRILHYVDATNGLLAYTNNDGTDYKGSCFYNAMLFSGIFTNTNLLETRFLNSSRFFEMGNPTLTFFVYPSLSDTILFYAIPPNPTALFGHYKIAMVKIVDGSTQFLRCWDAQDKDICTMDVTRYGDEIRIAHAGLGGTTHVRQLHPNNQAIPKEIARIESRKNKGPVNLVIWGQDGNLLATGCQDGHVRIWDIAANKRRFKSGKHSAAIRAMVWDKQNDILIAADGTEKLSVWRNASSLWKKASSLEYKELQLQNQWPISITKEQGTPVTGIHSLVFSSDKTRLAVGCSDGKIIILRSDTQTIELILKHHTNSVTSLVWYQQLISASRDRTVRIWPSDTHSGTTLEHAHAVGKVDLLPNGNIVSGVDPECTRMYFWDLKQQMSITKPDPLGIVSCMAARPSHTDHPCVAVGDVEGTVILYPIQDMAQPDAPSPKVLVRHSLGSVQHLSWSENGQYLAIIIQDRTLYLQDIDLTNEPPMIHQQPSDTPVLFKHMAWLQDAAGCHQLLVGCSDGSILGYSSGNKFAKPITIPETLKQLHAPIHSLATHMRSPYVAIADGVQINLIESSTLNVVNRAYSKPNIPKIIQWSSGGDFLVSIDDEHRLSIWIIQAHALSLYATYYDNKAEIRCLLWVDKWLILGLANLREILYWNMDEQSIPDDAPQRIPFRARFLSHSPKDDAILVARTTGIFFFSAPILNTNPGDKNGRFKLERLKAGVCAEAADLHGAQNVAVSTQQYLTTNGAINISSGSLGRQASFDSSSASELPSIPPFASETERTHWASIMPKPPLQLLSVFSDSSLTPLNSPNLASMGDDGDSPRGPVTESKGMA